MTLSNKNVSISPLFIVLNKQKKAAYIANSIKDSLRCGSFTVYDP